MAALSEHIDHVVLHQRGDDLSCRHCREKWPCRQATFRAAYDALKAQPRTAKASDPRSVQTRPQLRCDSHKELGYLRPSEWTEHVKTKHTDGVAMGWSER